MQFEVGQRVQIKLGAEWCEREVVEGPAGKEWLQLRNPSTGRVALWAAENVRPINVEYGEPGGDVATNGGHGSEKAGETEKMLGQTSLGEHRRALRAEAGATAEVGGPVPTVPPDRDLEYARSAQEMLSLWRRPPQTATTVYEGARLGPELPGFGDVQTLLPGAWSGKGRLTVQVTWEPEA